MTVSSTNSKVQYTAGGNQAVFPVSFRFIEAADLLVYLTPPGGVLTLQTLGTHYTVTDADGGSDFDDGGNVTFLSVPVAATLITITRNLQLTQALDLSTNGAIRPTSIEAQFDRLTMISQQQQEQLDRTLKVPVDSGEDATADALIAALNSAVGAAQTAKSEAEAAQTGAEAAQAGAEAAQDGAEAAQGAAEAAQAGAEAAQAGAAAAATSAASAAIGQAIAGICSGRLTLSSGNAVPTADVTAASTLYWTPYKGNVLSLYNGAAWAPHTFAELSLSLAALTAATNYDVYIYNNAGTLTLEAVAWSSDSVRATALALQDGVKVKSGAATRRYLGTIRTTNTVGQCEDSAVKRYVWNEYNRVTRLGTTYNTTANWTYATAVWREYNNGTGQVRFQFVCGDNDIIILDNGLFASTTNTSVSGYVCITVDTATSGTQTRRVNYYSASTDGTYKKAVTAGYHYCSLCEYATGATMTVYGGGAGVYDSQITTQR